MLQLSYSILTVLLFYSTPLSSQWTTLPVPPANRYDDVFFISDSTGWAVASNGQILHTTDAGASWEMQTDVNGFLRSIEFATPTLGFSGSLNGKLLKTTDGGEHWTDIAQDIDPTLPGICGLSAPTAETIYGCGIWSSPAYIIKSTDGGETWTTTDMSSMASALVDIHFISADSGFVSGKSPGQFGVGIILYTTDGGLTWTNHYTSDQGNEYIWKLQSPDGIHFFGAVANESFTGSTRMATSADKGLTWSTVIIDTLFNYIQTIGFLDAQHGWTGGNSTLFETKDGGQSWTKVIVGDAYNRFFKVNDSTAYLTGGQVYKYTGGLTSIPTVPVSTDEVHLLHVYPNPASDHLTIDVHLRSKTHCILRLFSADGQLLRTICDQPNVCGEKTFTVGLKDIAAQTLFVVLHTNEGVVSREVVKGL